MRPGACNTVPPVHEVRPPAASLRRLALAVAMAAAVWLTAVLPAAAQTTAETELARTYQPVLRLQDQPEACGEGEAFEPVDVDRILDSPDVALRGPWDRTNIVKVGPTAQDLSKPLDGYHLDFPGDVLAPGCVYERWERRIESEGPPTVYAHIATEAAHPGRLALQYWFFYVFNDWNNTHESDWEMIQLNFDAATPQEALAKGPSEAGYSQHSSAERADWGGGEIEVVDGTHPVVYPGAGSHANYLSPSLFLMRSTQEGVGCDDATGPHRQLDTALRVIPSDPAAAQEAYPWLAYRGRWGEKQGKLYEAPTGPSTKTQWTRPFTWSERSWRDASFTVPGGGLIGTGATDFFCVAVGSGSKLLRRIQTHPGTSVVVLAALAALLLWGFSKTAWRPSDPLPLERSRPWGAIITSAWAMYRLRPRAFLTVGLFFIPVGLVTTGLQAIVFRLSTLDPLVDEAGTRNAFVDGLVLGLGLVVTLLGFGIVQAATARLVLDVAAERDGTARAAYRSVLPDLKVLLTALVVAVAAGVVLNLSLVLVPVALFLIVRWSLMSVVVGVESRPAPGPLRRSAEMVRGSWWRTAAMVVIVAGAGLMTGPVVGALALVATGAAFDLVNLIAAVVYVAVLPLVAITLTYLYFDLQARAGRTGDDELPEPAAAPARV